MLHGRMHASWAQVSYFYWELVELTRRNILVGWVLLISTEHTFLRLVVALLFSIACLTMLLIAQPYARAEDNFLAAICQLTLVFSFVGAMLIRLYGEIEDATTEAVVERIMVFSSTTMIATPLVVVTLAVIAVMVVIMIVAMQRQGKQQFIRLVSTKMPPQLTLATGQKWQLFLSHTWASAQE